MTLAAGTRLGPYELQAPLGAGGMGEVYRARDTRLGRIVAIKVLPAYAAANPDRRRRFEYEARAASALEHPNICGLHDIGCESPSHPSVPPGSAAPLHFLVMEYVEGRTLAERLRAGPLPLPQVLDIGAQIAEALSAAHARGIIHRDLKPANIMLTGSSGTPRVKLLDFGLAKLGRDVLDAVADADTTNLREPLTSPGEFLGTLAYMSPEQLEGKEADARSDVFSFGCVLYEMLTGRRAFAGSSMASVISSIMTGTPVSAAALQPVTPYALDRLIGSCLAKDRSERRESIHDLAEDLRSIAASDSGRPTMPFVPARTPDPGGGTPPPHRRVPRVATGAAVLAVASAAFGAYLWLGPPAPDVTLVKTQSTQLTYAEGAQMEPAVAPDGSQVAFVSDKGGILHIWLVDTKGVATQQVTFGPDPDRDPAWLSDGSAILFTRISSGRQGIWMVPRLGGAASLLVADAADPAVSPDGSRLAFVREVAPSAEPRVFIAPINRPEQARQCTTDADGRWEHRHPAWSPDGRMLCYRAHHALWTVPADGGSAERLTHDNESARHPAWSTDGKSVYYTSGREGTVALWKVDLARRVPERMTLGTGPESDASVSRDGTTIVYSTADEDFEVILHDISTGAERSSGTRRAEQMPRFMPDGSAVLLVSDRVDGRDELWAQPLADGVPEGDARRVTRHDSGNVVHPAISPDGRWIAYYRVIQDQRDIYVVSADGVSPVQFTTDPASDIQPAWSRDGSTLAFTSERGGLFHIWSIPVAGGRPAGPARQITRGAAREMAPEWSPDGAWIAHTVEPTASSGDVWIVRSDGSGEPQQITTGAGALRVKWVEPDRMLVSGLWGNSVLSVRYVNPVTRQVTVPVPPIVFGDDPAMCDFDVDATREHVVFSRVMRTGNLWKLSGRF
jgi:Tol biopolymer transport system component/tRNA A-37 threonylcarbamoyl transferase component Bud32